MLCSDHMRIDPAYAAALRACGLDSVEAVLTRTSGRVAAWSRSTETLYVPGPQDAPGFFVKRYYYPGWGQRLRGALRGTFFGRHRGWAEFCLLNEMRRLGLPAVRPVAYGARRSAHFLTAGFLITEEVPEACDLTTFARRVRSGRIRLDGQQRRALARELARRVADLHALRFAHGQLFWRNILLRFGPAGDPEFFFLDVRPRRGGRRLRRLPRWWLHELAQLAASAAPFATRTEQVRFLVEYFGARKLPPDFKRYIHEIARLAKRWEQHEQQRIRMSERFEEWNRQLGAEEDAALLGPGPALRPGVPS